MGAEHHHAFGVDDESVHRIVHNVLDTRRTDVDFLRGLPLDDELDRFFGQNP